MNDNNSTSSQTDQKPKTDWKSREVGALWLQGEGEKQRATGSIKSNGQEVQVVMFRERNKKSPNGPDYRLYLSVPPEQGLGVKPEATASVKTALVAQAQTSEVDTSTALF